VTPRHVMPSRGPSGGTLRWPFRAAARVRIAEQIIGWWQHPDRDRVKAETRRWRDDHWAAARFAVQVHGLGPWLHVRLNEAMPQAAATDADTDTDTSGVPASRAFLAHLAHCHAMNTRRYGLWRGELERVFAEASRRAIPLVALKGAALIPTVWSAHGGPARAAGFGPALRPTSDIDLLARPADRAALEIALRRLGWALHGDSARHRVFYLARLGIEPRPHSVGEHPDQPLRLEIHEHAVQTFLGLRHDCTAALWQDPSPVPGRGVVDGGSGTHIMTPAAGVLFEHVLMHTAFDLAKRLTRVIKLKDLSLLAPHLSEEDWSRLVARACDARLERFYLAPLIVAERYLGAIAPTPVMEALERAAPRTLIAWLRRAPVSDFTACRSLERRPADAWSRLRWLPPGRARIAGARLMVIPSRAERLDEFVAAGQGTSLWAYYRAQIARWRR
jgi:hypothetical protein